ncbi:MAG: efflux RND transporter periplasmic adaptor subunit [Pyrinomonadaceae bacterium]|nr:efflux RND transporter periplasmic adaptor subunit [Pyrinomonadaceae bacterium]MCX7640059.1 efflux RND transporter periplasmic adaptor subunit [Pyrinomonadaceae bacterium]MDW8304231.1 efflux RND transporter periplasmic adaptor subunit [Acidobacteriota bacterium]
MKRLIFVLIFPAFIACGGSSAKEEKPKLEDAKVLVSTARAVVREVPDYFEATGSLVSDVQTDVAPSVGGKVVEVNFDIGSYVTKGKVLVRLDDRDAKIRLEQALAQVEQQKKAVQQAEANLEVALSNLAQTRARLGLKPNEEVYGVDDFPQVKATRAQFELAEKELRRAERLLESGDISRSIYDQRKSQRDTLAAQLADARANAMASIQAIETAKAQVALAKAAVAQAKAAVNTLETQVEQAKKALSDTVVLAPISGYVVERNVDPGEYVSPNGKVATIARTAILRIKIDVPERDIGLVRVGQIISLQTNSYPDRTFMGRIVRVSPSLNPTSRILTAEAEIENPEGLLKPGQFASVKIRKTEPKRAVMIPTAAVRSEAGIGKVFVIKDGRAEERVVRLGILESDLIEVQQGIQEGEIVAIEQLNKLFDGALVEEK